MTALDKIWSKLKFPGEFLAIEWHIGQSSDHFHVAHLKRTKQQVELVDAERYENTKALSEFVRNLPCYLLITGRKVLTKKVTSGQSEYNEKNLLQRAFPNVNQNDLITEISSLGSSNYAVSAIRKGTIDELLNGWPKNMPVLDLVLSANTIWPLVERLEEPEVILGNFSFNTQDHDIKMVEEASGETTLFGENIPRATSVAFLFGLIKSANPELATELEQVAQQNENWFYGRLFQKGLMVSGVFIFTILLVSFLGFSHYSAKAEELQGQTAAYDQQLQQLDEWKSSYEQKQQFLQTNGRQTSQLARYTDELCTLLPDDVTLEQLWFHPVVKRLKRENLVRYDRNILIVKGETSKYSYFQQWINEAKKLNWVNTLEIIGYEENDQRRKASFEIKISLAS